MPPFTFTADSGTEELTTGSNHGLVTGDGPAVVRNFGGALPAPLAGLTDYWAIVTASNKLKLATSQANALLGTAINLTTNGTGTNTLEIGIPYCRARTYAAGAQLKSVDLNAMMDALKAMHRLLTTQSQSTWSVLSIPHAEVEIAIHSSGFAPDGDMSGGYNEGNTTLTAPLLVPVGKRLTTVQVFYNLNGGIAALTPKVRKQELSTNTRTDVIAGAADSSDNVIESQTLTANHTVLSGYAYFIEVTRANALHRFYGAIYKYDQPAT